MAEIVLKEQSYQIMGACFEVYKQMGAGFLEGVYHECLEIELAHRGIPFVSKKPFKLSYRGRRLKKTFVPDLVCYNEIIVEIKAVTGLSDLNKAQIINYLNTTELKLGILVNFNHVPKLEYVRYLRNQPNPIDQS